MTATPARHGPEGIEARIGEVTGFALSCGGQEHGVLYLSGDTVWYEGGAAVGEQSHVGAAFLFLGAVQFDVSSTARLTRSAAEGAIAAEALGARSAGKVRSHYRESREQIEASFAARGLAERLRWSALGVPVDLTI